MCLSPAPNLADAMRRTACRVDDQPCDEAAQIEAAVEAVGEGGEVGVGMLGPAQRVIRAVQAGFEIAQDRVHPGELRQVSRLAITHHDGQVNAARSGHGRKAAQAVAGDARARRQVGLGPAAHRLQREACQTVQFEEGRTALVVQRDGRDERRLVLGAAARLAPGVLATEVSIIDLHGARELVAGLACRHGVVDLVVQRPGGGVAHTELALQSQRGQPGLGLADEVDRQEPQTQRQLGVLHQAAGGQRGLVAAALALKEPARTMADDVVLGAITAGAAKSLRPAGGLECRRTLLLAAEAGHEFRQRHATLELDEVERHGLHSGVVRRSDYGSGSSWREPAEARYQSGWRMVCDGDHHARRSRMRDQCGSWG